MTLTARVAKEISIYMEANPNPHAMKFVVNKELIPKGLSFDFPNVESTLYAPLARELFTYAFVVRVFYMGNFITVTKKKHIEWIAVQHTIQTHIKNFITSGHPIIDDSVLAKKNNRADSIIIQKIKAALDEHINPTVQQDGGSIAFHSYVNGVVTVSLQGACKGCPASTLTLKTGVENLLKQIMPDEVIAVESCN